MRLAKRRMWEVELIWVCKMRVIEFENTLGARMAGFVGTPNMAWRKDMAKRARKFRRVGDKAQ